MLEHHMIQFGQGRTPAFCLFGNHESNVGQFYAGGKKDINNGTALYTIRHAGTCQQVARRKTHSGP
jgi:hypothetical protein